MNRLTKVRLGGETDASGQVTLYKYDKRGLVTEEINALGDGKIYTYDAAGNLLTQTDEDGLLKGTRFIMTVILF
jgi:YD repeat-containing protein